MLAKAFGNASQGKGNSQSLTHHGEPIATAVRFAHIQIDTPCVTDVPSGITFEQFAFLVQNQAIHDTSSYNYITFVPGFVQLGNARGCPCFVIAASRCQAVFQEKRRFQEGAR